MLSATVAHMMSLAFHSTLLRAFTRLRLSRGRAISLMARLLCLEYAIVLSCCLNADNIHFTATTTGMDLYIFLDIAIVSQ